jgi:hypothetical protein
MEDLEMTLPDELLSDPSVLKDLIVCFWGHILYIRNQIPLPLSNITGEAVTKLFEIDGQLRSTSQTQKKLMKFNERFQSLSTSIDLLLSDPQRNVNLVKLTTVCIMVGPSPSNSLREAYFVHFDSSDDRSTNNGLFQATERKRYQVKRQLVRTMISNWCPLTNSTPIMNCFLAFHIKGSAASNPSEQQSNDLFTDISDFNLTKGFKIRL